MTIKHLIRCYWLAVNTGRSDIAARYLRRIENAAVWAGRVTLVKQTFASAHFSGWYQAE